MPRTAAIACLLLALAGCGVAGRTVSMHVTRDGHDVLYSEVYASDALAVFQCKASASGACHYTVYARPCTDAGPCATRPLHRFAVRAGERLFDTTLPAGFVACVSETDDGAPCPSTRPDA